MSHKEEAACHPGGHKQQAAASSLHSLIQRMVYSKADSVLGSEDENRVSSWPSQSSEIASIPDDSWQCRRKQLLRKHGGGPAGPAR